MPTVAQKAKVAADRPMTPYANLPATVSASRWMGAVRAWGWRQGAGEERGPKAWTVGRPSAVSWHWKGKAGG